MEYELVIDHVILFLFYIAGGGALFLGLAFAVRSAIRAAGGRAE